MSKWENTYEALKNFANVLACSKCGNEPTSAVRYINCGHFFCKQCTENESVCTICNVPVQPIEKCNDHLVNSLVSYCNKARELINGNDLWSTIENSRTKQSDKIKRINSPINNTRHFIPKKNINKQNAKGETRLHRACLKNQKDYVKTLLAAGADPNTKDHTGWTPLQEVVNFGYTDICQLLLECGTFPNVPGVENRTALHDAAINNRWLEAKMLLEYGAKRDVYDSHGKRPIDYCEPNSKIWHILENESESENAVKKVVDLNCTSTQSCYILYASNLEEGKKRYVEEMAVKHKIKIVSVFQRSVTHVIVEVNSKNIVSSSYDVMMALLRGCWLLNTEWIQLGMDLNDVLNGDLELFEVSGAPIIDIPKKARMNTQNKNPGLFHQCHFYFHSQPNSIYQINDIELTKDALIALVQAAGGMVLTREPNPEDIKSKEQCIPFHIANEHDHPLYKCTHYNIYVPERNEPRIKYNMPHIKTLPLVWLIECIEKFTLVNPSYLGLL